MMNWSDECAHLERRKLEELTQKEAEDAAAAAELQNALASSDEEAGGAPPEPPPTRQRTRSPNEEPDDPEPEDLGGVQGGDLHAGLNCEAPDPLQELLESDWNQADNKIAATVLKKPAQYRLNATTDRKVRQNVSCMRGFLPVNHMRRLFGALVQVGVWLQSLLEPTSANFRTFSVIEVEVWDETPLVGRPSDAPADSKRGAATNTLQCHRTRTVRLVLDEGTNRRCNEGFRFCAIYPDRLTMLEDQTGEVLYAGLELGWLQVRLCSYPQQGCQTVGF